MRLVLGPAALVAFALSLPARAFAGETGVATVLQPPADAAKAPPGPLVGSPMDNARPSGARRYLGTLVVGAVALASAATGAALVFGSAGDFSSLRDRCEAMQCTPTDIDPLSSRVHAGYALLAVGATALAVDLVQIVVLARVGRDSPRVAIAPTPGGVVATGSF